VALSPDHKLYFGQGAATNSGIVWPDSRQLSWLRKIADVRDIPGKDVVLTGEDGECQEDGRAVRTGAFQPFGVPRHPGQRIRGRLPCTSAIMRCDLHGLNLELVAWGLRNPYGLGFLPDGRLLALDLGFNDRGSRPVGNAPSCLFEVTAGAWYGWPDFVGGMPVTDEMFCSSSGVRRRFLLANHDELGPPQKPLSGSSRDTHRLISRTYLKKTS
jgi:glucose/arabinose dehydrogenase